MRLQLKMQGQMLSIYKKLMRKLSFANATSVAKIKIKHSMTFVNLFLRNISKKTFQFYLDPW